MLVTSKHINERYSRSSIPSPSWSRVSLSSYLETSDFDCIRLVPPRKLRQLRDSIPGYMERGYF